MVAAGADEQSVFEVGLAGIARPQSRISLPPPTTHGMTLRSAASRRTAPAGSGASIPSIVAVPMPVSSSSSVMRTMTVAPTPVGSRSQAAPCVQRSERASARICATDRSSRVASSACSLRCSVRVTIASSVFLMGAPVSTSKTPVRCSMPSRSWIVSDRFARHSSCRGSTPSGSSRVSARVSSRASSSERRPGARWESSRSAASNRAASTRSARRSMSPMIAEAALMPRAPMASAAATCGCGAGSSSPMSDVRGAVASPTCTILIASPALDPVVAWMRATGVRKPCFFASESLPSSTRDCRAISAATGAKAAST